MVVGFVLAAHVVALHVHREYLADLLDTVGVVHTANESGAVKGRMSLGIGQHVEHRIDGRGDGSFDRDLLVVAHTCTVPHKPASLNKHDL